MLRPVSVLLAGMGKQVGGVKFSRVWTGFDVPQPGLREALASAGAEVLSLPLQNPWEAVTDGDLLLLSVNYTTYNPFLLCSRLKQKTGSWITVVRMVGSTSVSPTVSISTCPRANPSSR